MTTSSKTTRPSLRLTPRVEGRWGFVTSFFLSIRCSTFDAVFVVCTKCNVSAQNFYISTKQIAKAREEIPFGVLIQNCSGIGRRLTAVLIRLAEHTAERPRMDQMFCLFYALVLRVFFFRGWYVGVPIIEFMAVLSYLLSLIFPPSIAALLLSSSLHSL